MRMRSLRGLNFLTLPFMLPKNAGQVTAAAIHRCMASPYGISSGSYSVMHAAARKQASTTLHHAGTWKASVLERSASHSLERTIVPISPLLHCRAVGLIAGGHEHMLSNMDGPLSTSRTMKEEMVHTAHHRVATAHYRVARCNTSTRPQFAVNHATGRWVVSPGYVHQSRGFRASQTGCDWGRQHRGLIRMIERTTGREFLPEHLVYVIIAINCLIFLLWQNSRLRRFMHENFTMSVKGVVQDWRIHTLFTHFWSHQSLNHLAANMITLWFFGTEAIQMLGMRRFLYLYIGAGLVSGLAQLVWPSIARQLPIPARFRASSYDRNLGASGAINSIVAFNILTFPGRIILLWFILPVPSAALGAIFLAKDLVGLYTGDTSVGNAGHIGGTALGAVAWVVMKRRIGWQRPW